MSIKNFSILFFCMTALAFTGPAYGSNQRMLEVLVEKGVLTSEEAQEIKGSDSSPADEETGGAKLDLTYDDGFCLGGADSEVNVSMNGLFQADYRFYDYEAQRGYTGSDPGSDQFDIRRARLMLSGAAGPMVSYKFAYEFEGASCRNLLDAFADVKIHPALIFRIGQFKEPFGLEASSSDGDLFFTEKAMGYSVTPQRDVGAIVHGSLFSDRLYYGGGIFNGDGLDNATGGNVDEPEACFRAGASPFASMDAAWLKGLHAGASASYIRTDLNNVSISASTAGMTEFFDVASRAKFNIIYGCDDLTRHGVEAAWTWGPCILYGEYQKTVFDDVRTSSDKFNIELKNSYLAGIWMITGEPMEVKKGLIQRIEPKSSLGKGGWGALGAGLRYDHFRAGDNVYDVLIYEGDSVREAKSWSLALNWHLNRFARLTLEGVRTEFDKPLNVYRDPISGTSLFTDKEDVVTCRFQAGF